MISKREARKYACRLVASLIDQTLNSGGWAEYDDYGNVFPSDEDRQRIEDELDKIAQRLFRRGEV